MYESTRVWTRGKHWTGLKCTGMIPGFNPTEYLWKDMKLEVSAIHQTFEKWGSGTKSHLKKKKRVPGFLSMPFASIVLFEIMLHYKLKQNVCSIRYGIKSSVCKLLLLSYFRDNCVVSNNFSCVTGRLSP